MIVLDDYYKSYDFSPDSRHLAVLSPDNSLCLYDLETKKELRRYRPPKQAEHVRWNPRQPQVAVGQENGCWILNLETGLGRSALTTGGVAWIEWHPSGRTLAVAGDAYKGLPAFTLYDVATGAQALPPLEGHRAAGLVMQFSHSGDAGTLRSPVTVDPHTGRRRYGPPEQLSTASFRGEGNAASAGGRVLALPIRVGVVIVRRDENRVVRVGPQEDARLAAVSPDGRWLATGSHGAVRGPAVKIWDTRTGELVNALPFAGSSNVRFGPDGKWLLTTAGHARLWSVGDWNEGPALPNTAGLGAFSADGSMLALKDVPGVVRLVNPTTGKEAARLTQDEPSGLIPFCFTRDATKLVCLDTEREVLQIFDCGAFGSNWHSWVWTGTLRRSHRPKQPHWIRSTWQSSAANRSTRDSRMG
jgi:WD40 repeat protein